MSKRKLLTLLTPVAVVLILDQFTKWLIRTTPALQDYTIIEGWLEFFYTKNPGMALGIDWLSTPVISVIAILATVGILIYILRDLEHASFAYLVCMGLILGGAFGNITDRIFMGIVGGYGGVLEGHVVDFIHFSLEINDWAVFPYIFNVADISISTAIISMIVFGNRVFNVEIDDADTLRLKEDMVEEEVDHPFREVMEKDAKEEENGESGPGKKSEDGE